MYKTKIKVHFHTGAWREGGREGGRKESRSENISLFPTEKLFCVLIFDISCLFFQLMPMYDYTTYTCIASLHCTQLFFFDFFLCCESVNVKVYKTAMMMLMRISTNISSVFAIIPSTLDILFWQISTFRKVRVAFVFGLPIL